MGKVAIVTGGAMGIGGATARCLAAAGAAVLIVDINEVVAAENKARIEAAGGEVKILIGDVSQEIVAKQMVERAVTDFGRLDILVQNAFGGAGGMGSALEVEPENWKAGMSQLVDALYLGPHYAVPAMEASGMPDGYVPSIRPGAALSSGVEPPTEIGRIVNLSSVHGILQASRHLIYEVGKTAVIGMTRQMAVDFGPLGITVNAIAPGHIMTENVEAMWQHEGNKEGVHLFELQYPVRRLGAPEDIAHAITFLCSPSAAFITGVVLPVDGGLSIQLQENIVMELTNYIKDHPGLRTHFDKPQHGGSRA